MIYLIKLIFVLIFSFNANSIESTVSEIIFEINNKFFTNIDLEKRTEYISILNNLDSSKFNEIEKIEILDDFISSLIFYEYYIENKIFYKSLNKEIDLIYLKNNEFIKIKSEKEIKNFKFNISIDLIRKKIIEEKLNFKKDSLLEQPNTLDLIYNYNTKYIIVKDNLIKKELENNINDRGDFNNLKIYLEENKIDFLYKEEDINNNNIISNKIRKMIEEDLLVYVNNINGYINIISIEKNLESYEGIFVKLINFKSKKPIEKKDLKCDEIDKILDQEKTIYKEYEYLKLNNRIKENLKSINDYILFNENEIYNYIILCDLTYNEELLKNINFNKNVNSLVIKIQNNFLKKYKNEFKFSKNK